MSALLWQLLSLLGRCMLVSIVALAAARLLRAHRPHIAALVLVSAFVTQLGLVVHASVARDVVLRVVPVPESLAPFADPIVGGSGATVEHVPTEPARNATAAGARSRLRLDDMLLWLWLAGAGMQLLRIAAGWRRLNRSRAVLLAPDESLAAVDRAVAGSDGRRVELRTSDRATTPYTFGVFRPCIVLPLAARAWPAERLRAVLLHEHAHVLSGDAATRLLARCLAALVWPNPLARLMVRDLEYAQERLADAAVVAHGVPASRYVDDLVAITREAGAARLTLALPFARSRCTVTRRARDLLAARTVRPVRPVPARSPLATASFTGLLAALPITIIAPQITTAVVQSATGCDYNGGRHLNRTRPAANGLLEWNVEWEGDGCTVLWRVIGSPALDVAAGSVTLGEPDTVEVTVHGRIPLTLWLAGAGTDRVVIDGVPATLREVDLRPLLLELDRHTAFALEQRLAALLAGGGLTAVIDESRRMQGDHAAASYLTAALRITDASVPERIAVLRAMAAHDTNDHSVAELLRAVSDHGLDDLALRASYQAMAQRLRSTAARTAALAALD